MAKLELLIIHCTATPEGREVTADEIRQWHTAPKPTGRGWRRVGYADLVNLDGSLVTLHPFDTDDDIDPWEVTNGVRGYNGKARHVVYAGGLDENFDPKDTRTRAQELALSDYVRYMVLRHPHIKVGGHNQFSNKDCPSFNVPMWLETIGIAEQHIYKA